MLLFIHFCSRGIRRVRGTSFGAFGLSLPRGLVLGLLALARSQPIHRFSLHYGTLSENPIDRRSDATVRSWPEQPFARIPGAKAVQ